MGDGAPGAFRMVSINEGVEANRAVNAMVSGYRIRLSGMPGTLRHAFATLARRRRRPPGRHPGRPGPR